MSRNACQQPAGRWWRAAPGAGLTLLAAGAALAADPPHPEAAAEAIFCRGEEPFWSLQADRTAARWTTPARQAVLAGRLETLDWLPPGWLVWRSGEAEPRLVAVLRAEACRSTMADTPPVSHRAILVRGDAPVATGCCTVTPAPDAAAAPAADPRARPPDD